MTTRISKEEQERNEYYLLTEKLDELIWALEGKCNDIDCDKYLYLNLLQKKYRPVLKHSFSCISHLKRDKEAVLRLLSIPKFKKYRLKNCIVCKEKVDTLSKDYAIVSFTRPSYLKGKKVFDYQSVQVHSGCKRKVKIPKGWNKF